MAKNFLVDVDLNNNELQNVVIQNLPAGSEPVGTKGQIYFDSTSNVLKIHDGTTWNPVASGGGEEGAMYDVEIDTSVLGITYVGQAAPGTSASVSLWRIKRISDGVNGSSVDWAGGTADFNKSWTDRLSYTYGP